MARAGSRSRLTTCTLCLDTVTTATPPQETPGSVEANPRARTLCEAFQATAARCPEEIALRSADTGATLTWAQYSEQVRRLAGGLAGLGVDRGDTLALMLSNRIEFYACDAAALHLGATPFSIYNTSSPEQIAYVFANARNRVVIAERQFLERLEAARKLSGTPLKIVCVDDGGLDRLERGALPEFDFDARWRSVSPDDVVTLIYTSGTTGPPKGVELTHANVLADCRAVAAVLPMRAGARITSYLPSAHAADRWSSHYNQMVYGLQVTTVADPRRIAAVLPDVRPTVWGGVPRIFEKLVSALEASGITDPNALSAEAKAAVRAKIGLDQAEWIICGAAPLARKVHDFLGALGLPIVELYGMSECTCVVTVCEPSDATAGTVGKAIPGVELRIADDGELLIRGPIVMRGYRDDPQRTAEALDDDGWLQTGDIADIDEHGYVRIVDRKKELIINAAGKNMSPANIEEQLKSSSPLIGQAICIGDARPYNVALLVVDPEAAGARDLDELAPEIEQAVARANERLSRVEQIKRFHVFGDEWLPGGDELTPTMKLKRKPIAHKYATVIEQLYA
jgi:long-subunit acyl-CoA synthetase (AMP-forming)